MASLDAEERMAMKALEEKLTLERETFSQAALKVRFVCGNGCCFAGVSATAGCES